jgi:hypothetical protein
MSEKGLTFFYFYNKILNPFIYQGSPVVKEKLIASIMRRMGYHQKSLNLKKN